MTVEKLRRPAPTVPTPDPLLAALITKLPTAGTSWSLAQRTAWLQLMWMAFNVVYEGGDGTIDLPNFLSQATPAAPAPAAVDGSGEQRRPPPSVTGIEPPRFYIAKDGRALRDPGGIALHVNDLPNDETLWDERPLGLRDLETIVWADGTWPPGSLPSLNIANG